MGKVVKLDASAGNVYISFTLPSPTAEVFVSWRMKWTEAAKTAMLAAYPGSTALLADFDSGPQISVGSDGSHFWNNTADHSDTKTPDAGQWYDMAWHIDGGAGTDDLTIDGVPVLTTGLNALGDVSVFSFELFNIVPTPGAIVYGDDFKFGTTLGGDDLGSDGFEDGTLDAWSDVVGDVTVFDETPAEVQALDRPIWSWIVTDLKTSRVLTEISPIFTDITTTRVLAAAPPASGNLPGDDPRVRTTYLQFDDPTDDEPFVAHDIRALIGLRNTGTDPLWKCAYAGPIFQCRDAVVDGVSQTTINSWGPRKLLEFLPLVDGDGNLPGENGITFTSVKANVIARQALQNFIDAYPGCLAETVFDLSSGADEDCAELTLTFGPGTMVNDVWTQLESAGAIDIVLDPVFDPRTRPGCLAVVNFEVEHGQARPAAIFSWDRSPRSLPEISRMEDGLKLANVIQDYTGSVDPAGQVSDSDSVAKYGERWRMKVWTDQEDTDAVTAFATLDLLFNKDGQTTVTANPATPRALQPIEEYDVGDRVPVYASERLRKPIASTMRIYEIPLSIDASAHETVTELVVSADAVAA